MNAYANPRPARKAYTPSPEQMEIVRAEAGVTKIQARAGTGKTTVLEKFAEAREHASILYLAFNKAVADEAGGRFPSNVTCRTGHSLAYTKEGAKYKRDKLGDIRPVHILHLPAFSRYLNDVPQAAIVVDTLKRYLNSADKNLMLSHIPEDANVQWPANSARYRAMMEEGRRNDPTALEANRVYELATKLWTKAQDRADLEVKMPHDGYLKKFQLNGPILNYDYIFLDEAQDSNPVILDIVLSQRRPNPERGDRPVPKIVLVGDNCQSIYGFREAMNAMENVPADIVLPLSRSYRFGHAVALVANTILEEKGETVMLSGREDIAAKIVMDPADFDHTKPHTFIARTNAGIIQEAINASLQNKPMLFVGGIDKYPLGLVEDAHRLWRGDVGRIKDADLRSFRNWDNLNKTATALGVGQEAILVRLVNRYKDRIPDLVESVRRMATDVPAKAELTLVSAHKSKGLEWERVRLAEDFFNPWNQRKEIDENETPQKRQERLLREGEEKNLLYVAVTRAIRELAVNESVRQYIGRANLVLPEVDADRSQAPQLADSLDLSALQQPTLQTPGGGGVVPLAYHDLQPFQDASKALLEAVPQLVGRMIAELPPERILAAMQRLSSQQPLEEVFEVLIEQASPEQESSIRRAATLRR